MSGVDDRVVSMKFDNASFEQKLGDTIKSLDKLRASLDFSHSTRGMNELSSASKNFSMSSLAGAVEGISSKFSALSVIGITTLANITTAAVSAGARMIKSLSLDPIMQGFEEYETNMNSIQTILANTKADGTNLEQVNAALDKLNTYSDQTIYNFSEMARNIGTFTAAGVNLDDSVNAIKGIANLAAISGSNSQQASTAMYQLSQALAAGKVNLMDWNSVVNAGMGGEVFKKALFETGKAMKTITDVPLGASFEEWEKKGGTFREQMEKGWLTADVLKTTLGAFSGDLDAAALSAMGFSDAAAQEMVDLGKMGQAAATEVKTMTQLISTVKESVGSGWSATFRTVIGDFEESKKLFTEINTAIGGFVGRSADARNALLQGWKDLGGREELINSFKVAITAVSTVLSNIKDVFRDIFPPMTAQRLFELTQGFADFMRALQPSIETVVKIRAAFHGLFAIVDIGWEVLKGVFGLIGDLLGNFSGSGGEVLGFAANLGRMATALHEVLVEGGGINRFFEKLSDFIKAPIPFIRDLKENILDFFRSFSGTEAVSAGVERIGNRFELLGRIAERVGAVWNGLSDALSGVRDVLAKVLDVIVDWFRELGQKIAAVMTPSDFEPALDAVNIGLLGGIALLLRKFIKNGLSFDFGGGVVQNISGAFEQLTGTLKAMQADLKANVLLKIAGAVGILTVSVVALSLIDSAALTKAMIALTGSFGLLIGAMQLLDKMSVSAGGSAKMAGLATTMILLATAVGILSMAVQNLSDLSWEELAKGLIGVTALLVAMTAATNLISANTSGMVRAGVAMVGIAIAMRILAEAVQAFAEMSWGEMAKGLVGVGVGLGLVTIAVNAMPPGMALQGAGLVLIATGMRILAEAVEAFGDMSWGEMGKGMVGIAGGLVIIAGAMTLMPPNLPITAAGVLILSVALNVMARAVEQMGAIDFGSMVKGIGGFAAMLGILAVATAAMSGTAAGAASLLVVSGAMLVLTHVLKELGQLSLQELAMGLGAMAGVLIVLGGAALILTPLIPSLLGLGVALGVVGGAFALFGVGAMLVAKALETIARAGKVGVAVLIESMELMVAALPRMIGAFIASIGDMAGQILAIGPTLIKGITAILGHLLDTVIELVPKIAQAIGAIITAALDLMREHYPALIETGFEILLNLLRGVRDNIGEITTLGIDIVTEFANSMIANMAKIVDTAVRLLNSFLTTIADKAGDITGAGLQVLVGLLLGITNNMTRVVKAAALAITTFIMEVGAAAAKIVEAGYGVLTDLLQGIADNINDVVETVVDILDEFIKTLGNGAQRLLDSGTKVLTDFLKGISDHIGDVAKTVADVIARFIWEVGVNLYKIVSAGTNMLLALIEGVGNNAYKVVDKGVEVILKFLEGVGSKAVELANGAADILVKFLNGMATAIRTKSEEIRGAGRNIAGAIISGITGGLSDKAGDVARSAVDVARGAVGGVARFLGIKSPSKVFIGIGKNMVEGMAYGLRHNSAEGEAVRAADRVTKAFEETLAEVSASVGGMEELNPVIRPVLDLSEIRRAAGGIGALVKSPTIAPDASFRRAQYISTTADLTNNQGEPSSSAEPTEIKFEQNIYAPTALSAGDIFRGTRSQIALAKEELKIA